VIDTALVVGAEKMSSIVEWKDRSTCVLFGDGAGAVVLKRAQSGANKGILSAFLRSDGKLAELLWRPAGGAAVPFSETVLQERSSYVKMAGREVFKHAVREMSEACDRALDGAKLTGKDIDVLIPHQANNRIIEATAKHANVPMEKVYVNVDRFGNTSSASIPIAIDEAIERGRIRPGTTALLCAFGAGFTWGSMVIRFCATCRTSYCSFPVRAHKHRGWGRISPTAFPPRVKSSRRRTWRSASPCPPSASTGQPTS
jgi:3-oxoacyl-[acyl-carrier-protein] synthase-3